MRTKRSMRAALTLLAVVGCAAGMAAGHGMIPRDTPIDRIISNVQERVKEHPNDAHAYYILGRAHALAFEHKNNNVYAWERTDGYRRYEPAASGWQRQRSRTQEPVVPSEAELKVHMTEAIRNLNKAIELAPAEGAYRLALASALESGNDLAGKLEVHPLSPVSGVDVAKEGEEFAKTIRELKAKNEKHYVDSMRAKSWEIGKMRTRDELATRLFAFLKQGNGEAAETARRLLIEDWKEQICEQYFAAMSLAMPNDGKIRERPIWGSMEDVVAYEAARCYVRIIESREVRQDEKVKLAVAKAAVKAFDGVPQPGGVTPIIFGMEGGSLSSLLDDRVATRFDLDGTGRGMRWEWVRPTTAILAWDPEKTGRISSGQKLFGSVSWWLMFRNGYEALDALDDNRDGEVSGVELNGLAVWFDRNSSGVSEPGEVVPVQELGIAGIRTTAKKMEGISPCNREGLRMADGRVLPTYDWIAKSVPDSLQSEPRPVAPVIAAVLVGPLLLAARRRRACAQSC